MKKNGLSLIELLVAMAILGTVGALATSILFTTLKGASKADIMREAKQNGDYALSVMERLIRNAQAVTSGCPLSGSQTGNLLTITSPDGQITSFFLTAGQQIASNAGMLTNDKLSVSNLSFTCKRTAGKPDIVTVSFSLSQASQTSRSEEKATIDFQTTVSLRTY